ncbi:Uncharacterized protein APZ42_003096, partial [Daphnia magna]
VRIGGRPWPLHRHGRLDHPGTRRLHPELRPGRREAEAVRRPPLHRYPDRLQRHRRHRQGDRLCDRRHLQPERLAESLYQLLDLADAAGGHAEDGRAGAVLRRQAVGNRREEPVVRRRRRLDPVDLPDHPDQPGRDRSGRSPAVDHRRRPGGQGHGAGGGRQDHRQFNVHRWIQL